MTKSGLDWMRCEVIHLYLKEASRLVTGLISTEKPVALYKHKINKILK